MHSVSIKKDNTLVRASSNLSLIEQRLIFLAIYLAQERKISLTDNYEVSITASEYATYFKTTKNNAYRVLFNISNTLLNKKFSYTVLESEKSEVIVSNWLQHVRYIESNGEIRLQFTKLTIQHIACLKEKFTTIKLKAIQNIKSQYALRLYELTVSWKFCKGTCTPVITVEKLREILGVSDDIYNTNRELIRRVIDPAISEINAKTDIILTREEVKKGRLIKGFKFLMSEKENNNLKIIIDDGKEDNDLAILKRNLTKKQLDYFSDALLRNKNFLHSYSANFYGKSVDECKSVVIEILNDKEKIIQCYRYLKESGITIK